MKRFDAVVVGAGLAGLTFADALAQRGFSVALADRKDRVDAGVHTTGIFVRRTFEDFSIPAHLLGAPVRDVVLFSPARRPLPLRSFRDEFRVGRMGALYEWLLKRCINRGVAWLPGAHFVAPTGDGAMFRTANGELPIAARLIVGADGCSSRVAGAFGLSTNQHWIAGAEEVFRGVPLQGAPRFECCLDPDLAPGYIAWVVHDGEEMHVGVGGYSKRFDAAAALEKFHAEVERRFDLGRGVLVERRGGRIPVGGVLRTIAGDHALLIGDAAGAVSPLTAGGLDGAIRLSLLAARVAEQHLLTGDVRVLRSYSGDLFRARFLSRRWMRRIIAALGSRPLLELSCALLRTPPGRAMAWNVFFGRGSFPDVRYPFPLPETAAGSSLAIH
jgi:flavin-dependent dehydrogenase